MLTMEPVNTTTSLLTALIQHNVPNSQSKHFMRYCERLLGSRFITSLGNTDWSALTKNIPSHLADKLDQNQHFGIIYFLNAIRQVPEPVRQQVLKKPVLIPTESTQPLIKCPPLPKETDEIISAILHSFIGVCSSKISVIHGDFLLVGCDLPIPVTDLVDSLLELSNAYRFVSGFVSEYKKFDGIIVQSFCAELSNQLEEYYRHV